MNLSSSDLEMMYDKAQQTVGLRFTGVTVPRNAVISEAYVQFTVDETGTGSTSLTVTGELDPDPGTFTSATNDITNRTPTSAFQTYSPAGWPTVGDAGSDQMTPNIKNVIQEIVDQSTWTSGNSMVILITGDTTSKNNSRIAESYDGTVSAAPALHIVWGP
jgi:hypothetical protein